MVCSTLLLGLAACDAATSPSTDEPQTLASAASSREALRVEAEYEPVGKPVAAAGVLCDDSPSSPKKTAVLTAEQLAAQLSRAGDNTVDDNYNPATGTYDINNGTAMLSLASSGTGRLTCGVTAYHIEYPTIGAANELIKDSAGLLIPTGRDARCGGPRPIVLYAHGTETVKNYDMSNLNHPMDDRVLMVAAMFAANGYIVVAPNYAGFDTSTLPYHPYLNARQQSTDMIDALIASRLILATGIGGVRGVADNGKLFITGHSQGGFVAMATHRAMQALGMHVTASAPSSGPYAMAAMGDMFLYGYMNEGASVFGELISTGFHYAYKNNPAIGDIFYLTGAPGDEYESTWLTVNGVGIDYVFPGIGTDPNLMIGTGQYPLAVFNSTPPTASDLRAGTPTAVASALLSLFPSITPPTNTGTGLDALFAASFGPQPTNLWRNSFRAAALADAIENPDGAFPIPTTLAAATSPRFPLRKALKRNDLRGWVPSGTRQNIQMCGGHNDPEVFFQINTVLMYDIWAAQGVPAVAPYKDVDPYPQLPTNTPTTNAALPNLIDQVGTAAATAFVVDVVENGVTSPTQLAVDVANMVLAFLPPALQTTTDPEVQAFLSRIPDAVASMLSATAIQGAILQALGSTPLGAATATNATLDARIGGLAAEGVLLAYHGDLVAPICHAAALSFFNQF